MKPFEFTEAMNEVTGYGGDYEAACRSAICAGAAWFASHAQECPLFVGGEPENLAAQSLRRAIDAAWFTQEDGRRAQLRDHLTNTMFATAMVHVYYIAKHGWNAYVDKMSAPLAIIEEEE